MARTEWFDSWHGETTAELIALEDRFRVDSIVVAFEQAIQSKAAADASKLSAFEWMILATEAMEREVNNGGFQQFFINSSAFFTGFLEPALVAIKCPETAAISKRAIDALGLSGSLGPDQMDAIIEHASNGDPEMEQVLEECNNDYFASREPIADRLFDFIKANAGRIVLPEP